MKKSKAKEVANILAEIEDWKQMCPNSLNKVFSQNARGGSTLKHLFDRLEALKETDREVYTHGQHLYARRWVKE